MSKRTACEGTVYNFTVGGGSPAPVAPAVGQRHPLLTLGPDGRPVPIKPPSLRPSRPTGSRKTRPATRHAAFTTGGRCRVGPSRCRRGDQRCLRCNVVLRQIYVGQSDEAPVYSRVLEQTDCALAGRRPRRQIVSSFAEICRRFARSFVGEGGDVAAAIRSDDDAGTMTRRRCVVSHRVGGGVGAAVNVAASQH